MKGREKKDLQGKTHKELIKALSDAREVLQTMQLDHRQGKLKNVSSLAEKRDEIARLLTVLNRRRKEQKHG